MITTHHSKRILLVLCSLLFVWASQGVMAQTLGICPLSQGYWANHQENWSVTGLMLGTQFYSQSELQVFLPGGGGDASTILAVQLIAARLNVAAGADSAQIGAALLQADTLLGALPGKLPYNISPSSTEGQSMVGVAAQLDSYNNGQTTPNCAALPTFTTTPVSPAPPTGTFTATPPPSRPNVVVVIQGPVQAINVNIITIAAINIQVNANDPILTTVQIGTPIRVQGTVSIGSAGTPLILAALVTLAPADATSVLFYIQGTVDVVNVNIITIAGISVQIDPANPILASVQVGDVVEINATVNVDGVTIIIVATTVVIVINTAPDATATLAPTTTPPTMTPTGTLTITPTPIVTLPITIVVEGSVEAINVNIITIYDIDIEININDPVLTQIQIGDFVRVEGDVLSGVDTITIIAITVFVVDIDIIVSNDNTIIWEDSGNCSNPPPPWAPANGWRRRCESDNIIIIVSGDDDDDGMGMGMGMGNDD